MMAWMMWRRASGRRDGRAARREEREAIYYERDGSGRQVIRLGRREPCVSPPVCASDVPALPDEAWGMPSVIVLLPRMEK